MKRQEDELRDLTDKTPLRVPGSTGISHDLCRPNEKLLVIRPVRFFPILGGCLGLVFILVGAVVLLSSGHRGGWFVGGIGALFLLLFCLIALLSTRFEFDRGTAVLQVRRFGSDRRYPLDRISAVQLIHGGWHGGHDRPSFNTYQLNLVVGGADRSRMNVTNMANWEATWGIAWTLSRFLSVPLQDEVSEGSTSTPD
jgi:hypothetical protein